MKNDDHRRGGFLRGRTAAASQALKLVEMGAAPPDPRPGVCFVPSAQVSVECFEQATKALGLAFNRMTSDAIKPASGAAEDLLVIHLVGSLEQCLAELANHAEAYRDRPFAVLGEENDALVEACLRAGALGFIPSRFDTQKMAWALGLIRAGERFFPQGARRGPPILSMEDLASTRSTDERGITDYRLTKTERDVLSWAAKGYGNLQIAQYRRSKEGTIKVHMNHIFRKLGVNTRCEAIALYFQTLCNDPDEWRRLEAGTMDMRWLLSTMTHQHCKQGTVLFRQGDCGNRIYYLQHGYVNLQELGLDMKPNDLFGEIGVFAPGHRRSATAVCKTDVELFTLSYDEVRRSYFLNPQFAFAVMRLVTERLMADGERARAAAKTH